VTTLGSRRVRTGSPNAEQIDARRCHRVRAARRHSHRLCRSAHTDADATPAPPADPEIDLEGSADDNLAYFDFVNKRLMDEGGVLDGRDFIDSLVAAGYPKADMEVTPDSTAIGILADNIQFAIRLNGTCLIGQYGNVGYHSTTGEVLSTGRCLVGQTRPITW
jgi:hypothetical protein